MPLKAYNIAKLSDQDFLPADLFICCASFEKRCLTIPNALGINNVRQVIIAKNINIPEVNENANHLKSLFSEKSTEVNISTNDPLCTVDNLMAIVGKAVLGLNEGAIVVLDISTFTHESLLIVFQLLYKVYAGKYSLIILYNSASEYSIGDPVEKKWLSNGIDKIRTVLGYAGDIQPNKKTHLLLFVGYEAKRAAKLIEMLEPNAISLGYGEPGTATNEKHEAASKHFHAVVEKLAVRYCHVERFSFSCSSPLRVSETMLKQAKRFANYNTVIAPMNTKLSTLGTAIAALENNHIQLCYAPAVQYNFANYSLPSKSYYKINIDSTK